MTDFNAPTPGVRCEAGLAVVVQTIRVCLVAVELCGLLEEIAAPALLSRHGGLLQSSAQVRQVGLQQASPSGSPWGDYGPPLLCMSLK